MYKANVSVNISGARRYTILSGPSEEVIRAKAQICYPSADFIFVGPLVKDAG